MKCVPFFTSRPPNRALATSRISLSVSRLKVTAVQQTDTHMDKLSALRDKTKLKLDELGAAIQETDAKRKQITDASKKLKTQVEAKMAKLLSGRKVVITGTGA